MTTMMQMHRTLRNLGQLGISNRINLELLRTLIDAPKRHTQVPLNEDGRESCDWMVTIDSDDISTFVIKLNGKEMKTPMSNSLRVPNMTLALAIANEWRGRSRRKKLNITSMYLTTMAYEAIDNPFGEEAETLVDSILEYLKFDTVRFRDTQNQELLAKQSRHWDPMIGWIEHEFHCHLPIDYNALTDTNSVPDGTMKIFKQHLLSHERWPLIGARFITQNLKSFVLASSLMTRFLTPEQAVELARLETKHQTDKWTEVEWEHDIDEQCTNARVAAGNLFYHLTL